MLYIVQSNVTVCHLPFDSSHYETLNLVVYFFGHMWAAKTSCEHNIDISSPFSVDMANLFATVGYLHIQQLWSNIIILLEYLASR